MGAIQRSPGQIRMGFVEGSVAPEPANTGKVKKGEAPADSAMYGGGMGFPAKEW